MTDNSKVFVLSVNHLGEGGQEVHVAEMLQMNEWLLTSSATRSKLQFLGKQRCSATI